MYPHAFYVHSGFFRYLIRKMIKAHLPKPLNYLRLCLLRGRACDNAEPATDREFLLYRLSLNIRDALRATDLLVCFLFDFAITFHLHLLITLIMSFLKN